MKATLSSVQLRAPSKVILSGENAVVFGATAVACAIDLPNSCRMMEWDNAYFRISTGSTIAEFDREECIATYHRMMKLCNSRNYKEIEASLQRKSLLWVIAIIGKLLYDGIHLPYSQADVHLAVPLGSGLGGSTTTTVLIVKSLLLLAHQPVSRQQLYELSALGDRIAHGGTGSGTDSAAIVRGGCISYHQYARIRDIKVRSPLQFVLCDSGEDKISSTSLARFRQHHDHNPVRFQKMIAEFNTLSTQLITLLESSCAPNRLGSYLNRNHTLLQKMGVSTAELDKIVQLSLEMGAAGAKLTGGGCGGYALILARPAHVEKIVTVLKASGKSVLNVKLQNYEGRANVI